MPKISQRRGSRSSLTILLGFILTLLYFFYLLSPSESAARLVRFEIERGESVRMIARRLSDTYLTRSPAGFTLYAFLSGSAHRLKPGIYELNAASTTPQIMRALVAGPPTNLNVLIPEGYSLRDIEETLVAFRILKPGGLSKFLPAAFKEEYPFLGNATTLEGFLFPDTYRFAVGSSPEDVVRKFLDTFAAKALLPIARAQASIPETLILASYLEREIPLSEDRPLVAGIFRRRLSIGMLLQVDATVLYARCSGAYRGCPPLVRGDFSIDSPFNTYTYQGFTPTPIANPGLDAILAALAPKRSAFLYYLSDPETKKTIFSRTLDEHNRNRIRYLDI